MWNYYGGHMLGWEIGGWLMMIVFWVAVIGFIVWLVREAGNSKTREGRSALEVLKERYAKGEIDKKEFEEKKKDLS